MVTIEEIKSMKNNELFTALKENGFNIGPINDQTRVVYEKKLLNYVNSQSNVESAPINGSSSPARSDVARSRSGTPQASRHSATPVASAEQELEESDGEGVESSRILSFEEIEEDRRYHKQLSQERKYRESKRNYAAESKTSLFTFGNVLLIAIIAGLIYFVSENRVLVMNAADASYKAARESVEQVQNGFSAMLNKKVDENYDPI